MEHLMRNKPTLATHLRLPILGLFLIFTIVACSNNQLSPTATPPPPEIVDIQVTVRPSIPTMEPYVFITSEPGYATLFGRLIVLDPRAIVPAPDDAIYLVELDPDAPISTIPMFEEGDDIPQADVDERTGEFVFVNVEAGRYAVVAVTMGGTQFPTRMWEDGSYAIFDITEEDMDQEVDLGDLTLP
jgi:hypothetical protein